MLRRLETFEAPYLEEKMVDMEKTFASRAEYDQAFTEFKKYFAIGVMCDNSIGMASKTVDSVWHQFILFTKEYHGFSHTFAGHYFHHAPTLPSQRSKEGSVGNFIKAYTAIFGSVPSIWGISREADCDGCGTSCKDCCDTP